MRYSLSVSVVSEKVYVIGGCRSEHGKNLSILEEYDPKANRWTRKADMPTRRFGLATAVMNGKIYAFSGADTLSRRKVFTKIEEYIPQIPLF